MTSPFIAAMHEALARITSAESREDRLEAEEYMAQLIRAQYRDDRIRQPRDVKAAQANDGDA